MEDSDLDPSVEERVGEESLEIILLRLDPSRKRRSF